MERIDLADFLLIAESHTGIDAHQLARMDRVVALAGSALAAPFAGYGDFELFPEFADRAAIYASRILRNHPLPDGNKRTAYDVMAEFIERNGAIFEHGHCGDDRTSGRADGQRGGVPRLGAPADTWSVGSLGRHGQGSRVGR